MENAVERGVLAVIPARFASTRFPEKVIAPLAGKPLVLHAYERACQAQLVTDVCIATDDQRVVDALAPFEAKVIMTSPDHASGTDRTAEVARGTDAEIIVNVQGDEPLMPPELIDGLVQSLMGNPSASMATARRMLDDPNDITNANVVKVVCDLRDRALFFSRWPIPYVREDMIGGVHWQHIGLYAYRRDFLLEFASWAPTPLEILEKLEQLRALEHGASIAVVTTDYESVGVDTPEDLQRVASILDQTNGR